jgi:hypothetical protein
MLLNFPVTRWTKPTVKSAGWRRTVLPFGINLPAQPTIHLAPSGARGFASGWRAYLSIKSAKATRTNTRNLLANGSVNIYSANYQSAG